MSSMRACDLTSADWTLKSGLEVVAEGEEEEEAALGSEEDL